MSLDKIGNNSVSDYYQASKVKASPDALASDLSGTKTKIDNVSAQVDFAAPGEA